MSLLRKMREIGTVRTIEVVRADLADAERNAERLPTARNLERVERIRSELDRRTSEASR